MNTDTFTKKFKIFLPETNSVYYWYIHEDFNKTFNDQTTKGINSDINPEYFKPKQFTGFYDKNGIEIYENDYIKLNNETDCFVDFQKGSFILKFFNSNKKIWFHNIKKTDILENMGQVLVNIV
jgi:hypothetical protein